MVDVQYTVLEALPASGGRELFRATRKADGRQVLVKVLPAQHRPEHLERLRNEYEIARTLPSAVRPVAFERYQGRPALVLEDFGEGSLEERLGAPLEIEPFLRLAVAIAAAVADIHHCNVVHKDLKPGNILIDPASGAVRISEFGIAAPLSLQKQPAGSARVIEGSLPYMSPEQTGRMNRPIDQRSDLYSLGVTFYQMLTGNLPFQAADAVEWVHCHVARAPAPLAQVQSTVPAPISALVMKLLAKSAEDRYQSARGLHRDLERCLVDWLGQGEISPFPLGQQDLPQRWQIPHRLYGRERELQELLGGFTRVRDGGGCELVLVSGYSGIGKSSLVNELQAPIVRSRGLFAAGKFTQHDRESPYRAFAQALGGVLLEILAESDDRVVGWRARLQTALGGQGQLIIDVVPLLGQLIGPQPPVPVLPPAEAQHRFRLVFRRFVAALARDGQPLALFVDDLQWADPASLALLRDLVAHPETPHLFVVGAYRSNEVGPGHPLGATFGDLQGAGAPVSTILLEALPGEDLNRFLGDVLHRHRSEVEPLKDLVQEKTGGNPFFVIQFLGVLRDERLVELDDQAGVWHWDLAAIRAKGFTDNVGELMATKLRRLPDEARLALKYLACLAAASTDGLTLGQLLGVPEEEADAELAAAMRAGLLQRNGHGYKFPHDRVREAAYQLIAPDERASVHLQIGRSLLAHTPGPALPERIFDIVEQLNRGSSRITSDREHVQLARLNLLAGERSRAATAYSSALAYFETGAAALAGERSRRESGLAYSLLAGRAECAYATGDFSRADELSAALLVEAPTAVARARAHSLRVSIHTSKADFGRAIAGGLECLRSLGIDLDAAPTLEDVQAEEQHFWELLGDRSIEDLLALPDAAHVEVGLAMEVLAALGPPTYFNNHNLYLLIACRMAVLSLRHGHAAASPVGYGLFGTVTAGLFDKYRQGQRLAAVACALVDQPRSLAHRPFVYLLTGLIDSFNEPLSSYLVHLDRCFQAARENGALTFAVYISVFQAVTVYTAGEGLDEVFRQVKERLDVCEQAPTRIMADGILGLLRLTEMLRGRTARFGSFDGPDFSEESFEAYLRQPTCQPQIRAFYYIFKLQARYMAGDHPGALAAADEVARSDWMSVGQPIIVDCTTYTALALAATGSTPERLPALVEALSRWAANCPENFQAPLALVSAEIARSEGRDLEALRLYDQAIHAAAEHGFNRYEGLAGELAARFHRARGADRVADAYLREARDVYRRWGALGKVAELDRLHPQLREKTPVALTATVGFDSDRLDLLSVVKASQAISGEIVLDRLLRTLTRVVIEQAGAERGYVILHRHDELTIEAEAVCDQQGQVAVELLRSAPVASSPLLSPAIVKAAFRTRERVLLDNALASRFASDEYVLRARPKSVLCLPILRGAELVGLLYLENNLVEAAFTAAHLAVLELLAAQAAISLDNANHLAQEETARRQALDALCLREEFLTVASHELRTPMATLTMCAHALLATDTSDHPLTRPGQEALLRNIGRQVRRLNQLVSELLEVSFIQRQGGIPLEIEEMDLGDLAREVVQRLAPDLERAGCPVSIQAEAAVTGRWDRSRLDQVIVNLLSNAMKFGPGQPIEVAVVKLDRSTARLLVRDRGIGVAADSQLRIFERFERAVSAEHYGGLGLGLYICRRIVEAHQGSIGVASPPGAGATFQVDLPGDP